MRRGDAVVISRLCPYLLVQGKCSRTGYLVSAEWLVNSVLDF